jgi:hypothetical protein
VRNVPVDLALSLKMLLAQAVRYGVMVDLAVRIVVLLCGIWTCKRTRLARERAHVIDIHIKKRCNWRMLMHARIRNIPIVIIKFGALV